MSELWLYVVFWFVFGGILIMAEKFPFDLADIAYWIVKRKDGTSVKYSLKSAADAAGKTVKSTTWTPGGWSSYHSCDHEPHPATDAPVFSAAGIGLWIADSAGARKSYPEFDVCIDGGGVLPGDEELPKLYGDTTFRAKLISHVISSGKDLPATPKIIKLRWYDREAPPVWPSFWPALAEELKLMAKAKAKLTPEEPLLRVLTICVGGHGRSGTALTSLMMCLSDYSALEALTHIRAVHCSRAIESKVQHIYLNAVAEKLGRDADALEAEKISSFKEAFLASTSPTSAPYMERVRSGKGAAKSDSSSRKDDPFCAL